MSSLKIKFKYNIFWEKIVAGLVVVSGKVNHCFWENFQVGKLNPFGSITPTPLFRLRLYSVILHE